MYGVFFMFLAISIMIIYVMVPMIESQAEIEGGSEFGLGIGFSDPCEGVGFFPCDYFSMVCTFFDTSAGIGCYYLALFFTVILIQGLFTGLIAGQLGENSVISGGKHAMIMVLSAIGIFIFLAKAGLLAM